MAQSLSKVYIHIVFSTKNRIPFIDDEIKAELWKYLWGICKQLECLPVQIWWMEDHIHILCTLSRKISQMQLVKELKAISSQWIKWKNDDYGWFYWQEWYGIFSVDEKNVEVIKSYIINQEKHHQERDFQWEILNYLRKYQIEYDEKYLWS